MSRANVKAALVEEMSVGKRQSQDYVAIMYGGTALTARILHFPSTEC